VPGAVILAISPQPAKSRPKIKADTIKKDTFFIKIHSFHLFIINKIEM